MKRTLIPFLGTFLRNYLESKESIKNRDSKEQMLNEFYNYKYWREVQRNQLTIVSNIYFGFSTALIGYSLNLLINDNSLKVDCCIKTLLIMGIALNVISLFFYVQLTNNKLNDYKKTAELIKDVKNTFEDISSKTKGFGIKTWDLFKQQKTFLIIGFIVCLVAYSILILKK